jgi:cyanophycinase
MSGYILLEGGAEFGGQMAEPDLRAIELAGGFDAPICVLPTAAALDHNEQNAGGNAERWFRHLGARLVKVLPIIDRSSANQPSIAATLRGARLIYMLGGFPGYLGTTLAGSLSWQVILEAYRSGAVVGGSSAGAMVLCEHYYDPDQSQVAPGLNLLPNACIIPHHNNFGKDWALNLAPLLPHEILVGIDERTGMIDDDEDGQWKVYGQGAVTLYKEGVKKVIPPGKLFSLKTVFS